MRRSDHPSRPSARTCCCLLSPKTLLMTATEPRFLADVNVSAATVCGGRFSGVHQWPDLGVHRGFLDHLKLQQSTGKAVTETTQGAQDEGADFVRRLAGVWAAP